jgi:hypothetical protein
MPLDMALVNEKKHAKNTQKFPRSVQRPAVPVACREAHLRKVNSSHPYSYRLAMCSEIGQKKADFCNPIQKRLQLRF